jgi:hypothetical protein
MEYDDLDKEQLLEIITVLNQTVWLSNKNPSDIVETHFRNKTKPVKQGFIKEDMFEITESLYGIISETELNQAYNKFKKVRIKTGCRFVAFININDLNVLNWYDDNNLGISVCNEWAEKYLENIGPIKPKLTLV